MDSHYDLYCIIQHLSFTHSTFDNLFTEADLALNSPDDEPFPKYGCLKSNKTQIFFESASRRYDSEFVMNKFLKGEDKAKFDFRVRLKMVRTVIPFNLYPGSEDSLEILQRFRKYKQQELVESDLRLIVDFKFH